MTLRVKILGCGTSTGVPVLGCECNVCLSSNPKNHRWRASILFQKDGSHPVVIDTGPEFRLQLLRAGVKRLQHVLYSHLHADHCHGFDDLRGLFFNSQLPIQCWLRPTDITELKQRFHYAFEDTGYLGGRPDIRLQELPEKNGRTSVGDYEVESFVVPHGNALSTVFRIQNFVYATDFKVFPDAMIDQWRGKIHTMVASGLRWKEHRTHSTIDETLRLFERLGVQRGIVTHMSHDIDYDVDRFKLGNHVEMAYDGLEIEVPST